MEVLQSLIARDELAIGRKNRRDAHEILRGDACVTKRELEGGETLLVLPDSFRQKQLRGNHVLAQCRTPPETIKFLAEFLKYQKVRVATEKIW
jgi:hypothetical protein